MTVRAGRRFLPFAVCVCALAPWLFTGCSQSTRVGGELEITAEHADTLYSQLKSDFQAGDFQSSEVKARELIHGYPGYSKADEVYVIAARASRELDAPAQVVKYSREVPEKFPLSPYRDEALFLAADAYRALGKYYESADAISRLLDSPLEEDVESRALTALRKLSQDYLTLDELERLIAKYPDSPLAGDMSLALAKREFARGNYEQSYKLLAELIYQYPQHKNAPEVRQLLKLSASRRDDPERRAEFVDPYKIGVLLPRTGNVSRFGRYFEQGINIALDEFNATSNAQVSVAIADTKGSPVDAVGAVRDLVLREGVLAVLGAVFSVPSIAAAIECNAWKVPMLSSVVTEQRVEEVGPWIFQTKIATEVEVSVMARIAREELLLEKFAVLSPSSPRKQTLAELFVREITALGGDIVAEEYYKEGDTDFKGQLEVIRDSAPEALFIPGDPEDLLLLLPQVSFYDMQLQLLGLSNWNSEKLLRLSKRDLEGALFPSEAHHGKSRQSYQQFLSSYRERFGGEAPSVAAGGYFGMRLLLEAVRRGAVDRGQVREFLVSELEGSAQKRMAEAASLAIMKVRSGKVREYTAYRRTR